MDPLIQALARHHPARVWDEPEEFRPERFLRWDGDPFNFFFIHRCPGEGVTIELMNAAASFLAGQISYDVPEQDLRID